VARPNEPTITLTMSLQRLNEMMAVVAKGPFETVAEMIADFRTQAQDQVNTLNQQAQQPGPRLVEPQPGG
jgi:hypothetical protein